jgi:hypothetical protein
MAGLMRLSILRTMPSETVVLVSVAVYPFPKTVPISLQYFPVEFSNYKRMGPSSRAAKGGV